MLHLFEGGKEDVRLSGKIMRCFLFVMLLFLCGCSTNSAPSTSEEVEEVEGVEEAEKDYIEKADCFTPKVKGHSKVAVRNALGNYPTKSENQEDEYRDYDLSDVYYGVRLRGTVTVKYDSYGMVKRLEIYSTSLGTEDIMNLLYEYYDENYGYVFEVDEHGCGIAKTDLGVLDIHGPWINVY